MSTPWEAFAAWRSGNLLNPAIVQTNLAVGDYTLFSGQLSTWGSVHLRFVPTLGNAQVVVSWFADQAQTQQIGTDSFSLSATISGVAAFLPVKGPFATVVLHVHATWTAAAYFAGLTLTVGRVTFPIAVQTIDQENISLALSTSAIYFAPLILGGVGFVSFNPHDATGKLTLNTVVVNADGTVRLTMARLGAPTALLNQQVGIVDQLFGFQVINTDTTAAHAFDLGVTLLPQVV